MSSVNPNGQVQAVEPSVLPPPSAVLNRTASKPAVKSIVLSGVEKARYGKVSREVCGAARRLSSACVFLLCFFQIITQLGGVWNQDPHFTTACTHLVMGAEPNRSEKFLAACAAGIWILKPSFLTASSAAGLIF